MVCREMTPLMSLGQRRTGEPPARAETSIAQAGLKTAFKIYALGPRTGVIPRPLFGVLTITQTFP